MNCKPQTSALSSFTDTIINRAVFSAQMSPHRIHLFVSTDGKGVVLSLKFTDISHILITLSQQALWIYKY